MNEVQLDNQKKSDNQEKIKEIKGPLLKIREGVGKLLKICLTSAVVLSPFIGCFTAYLVQRKPSLLFASVLLLVLAGGVVSLIGSAKSTAEEYADYGKRDLEESQESTLPETEKENLSQENAVSAETIDCQSYYNADEDVSLNNDKDLESQENQ